MDEIKQRCEAILFSSGRLISIDELAKLARIDDRSSIQNACLLLQKEYIDRESPIGVFISEAGYKLAVNEKYLPFAKKITAQSELSKTIMETLAIIAWKSPILQSEVINIRTNKAYEHIDELEKLGFLIKEKHSRTYLLKLTQKFYDYFDISNEEEMKKKFEKFKERAQKKINDNNNVSKVQS